MNTRFPHIYFVSRLFIQIQAQFPVFVMWKEHLNSIYRPLSLRPCTQGGRVSLIWVHDDNMMACGHKETL